ncbi:hypothetical protein DUI87_12208 [Hirundo rustica rustica]|uniref:Uncharacterized protein n=1 Tax=Hirundo rustica rustica TaxID=333673 RepID=A0A3M0KCX0_HIRRU|nr:hypothetical protein DUI87_12208 [Hirundo rustica rustica]
MPRGPGGPGRGLADTGSIPLALAQAKATLDQAQVVLRVSLDSARAALGVAEDGHLLLALAAVALSCEVARRGLGTSRRHLAIAAGHQRDMAQRLRHLRPAGGGCQGQRRGHRGHQRGHRGRAGAVGGGDAGAQDLGGRCHTRQGGDAVGDAGTGFPNAVRVLRDIVVALGTSGEGHEEVARRLEVAQEALAGQG